MKDNNLYEYAIEPKAIGSSWDRFRYIMSLFGFQKGRIISDYPNRKWKRLVHEAVNVTLSDNQKNRIRNGLDKAYRENKIMRFGRSDTSGNRKWKANAILQHKNSPFRAIIACRANFDPSYVLSVDEIEEVNIPVDNQILREVNSLISAFHSLLRFGRRIEFVDPYFRIDRKLIDLDSRKLITRSLSVAKEFGNCSLIKVHYKDHENNMTPTIRYIREKIGQYQDFIPEGTSLEIYRWRKTPSIEYHDRHLLTDKGGISVGAGFAPKQGETTTLARWSAKESVRFLDRFDGSGHELVEPGLRILPNGKTEIIE